jgi:hypothetical protein
MSLAADKFAVSGTVLDADGESKKKVSVELSIADEKPFKGKTNRKGAFKIKKVVGGEYSLKVFDGKNVLHEEMLTVNDKIEDYEIKIASASAETPAPVPEVVASVAPVVSATTQTEAPPLASAVCGTETDAATV